MIEDMEHVNIALDDTFNQAKGRKTCKYEWTLILWGIITRIKKKKKPNPRTWILLCLFYCVTSQLYVSYVK